MVAIFLGALARGETPRIFGDGSQTRDYVYAGDVARASLAAAGQDGGVFNVGTGIETSVLELYELCRRVAGSDLQAEHAEGDVPGLVAGHQPGDLLDEVVVEAAVGEPERGHRQRLHHDLHAERGHVPA